MYGSEEFWIGRLLAGWLPPLAEIGGPDEAPNETPEQILEGLMRDWPPLWRDLNQWYGALTEEDLARELPCRLPDGCDFHFARWQLLRHMVNHSTLHRGQVTGMLRALGKQPPNGDLMSYYLAQR
jgi:uncharacterized damage-inducible protein DinB